MRQAMQTTAADGRGGDVMGIPVGDLKVGDVLYDVHAHRMGNTMIREESCWTARVVEVHADADPPYALISWNGNKPRKEYRSTSYKRWPKEWMRKAFGPRKCAICYGTEDVGHKPTCKHPRAISKRKKAQRSGAEGGE